MKREILSRGIVIRKHFPQKVRISVLDEKYGHLSAIPASWQWASYASVGSILSYELVEENDIFFVKQIELLSIPTYQNELLLLFTHHLLEICYFYIPICSGKTDCFDLLYYIINELDNIAHKTSLQRLLLAKLLFMIGQYPADVDQLTISSLLYKPYGDLVALALTDEHKRELEIFIYQCIKFHPYGRLLKTVNFLSRVK